MPDKRTTQSSGIEPPRLPPKPDAGGPPLDQLDDLGTYTGLLLSSCDLSEQAAEDVTFEAVLLKHVGLGRTRLPSLQLHDVRLDACDLAEAEWEKPLLSRVEMLGCRMVGWRASEGSLRN